MIPYGRQDIGEEDIQSVAEALRGDFLTTGSKVEEFEELLRTFIGNDCIVVNSGTAALHSAYYGIDIKPGDEIITPPNTFIATQATATMLGARIVFADIDIQTGLISRHEVAEKITERTKAIVLVDYAGQPCDIDFFTSLAKNHGLFIVQDAAHSLGSTYKNRQVGSLVDVTTFSFYPTKNITTGEGGAIASKNKTILSRAKLFARQGLVRDPNLFLYKNEGNWHQEVHDFGLNYRLPDILCALGISQLKKIQVFKEIRKSIFEKYKKAFEKFDYVRTISVEEYSDPMWHLFPIFVDRKVRGDLFRYLQSAGIGVRVNYFPSHLHPVFRKQGFEVGDCKNAEAFYETEISLPIHTRMKSSEIEHVIQSVKLFFGETCT